MNHGEGAPWEGQFRCSGTLHARATGLWRPQALMATARPCRGPHWGAISAQSVGHRVDVGSHPLSGCRVVADHGHTRSVGLRSLMQIGAGEGASKTANCFLLPEAGDVGEIAGQL